MFFINIYLFEKKITFYHQKQLMFKVFKQSRQNKINISSHILSLKWLIEKPKRHFFARKEVKIVRQTSYVIQTSSRTRYMMAPFLTNFSSRVIDCLSKWNTIALKNTHICYINNRTKLRKKVMHRTSSS